MVVNAVTHVGSVVVQNKSNRFGVLTKKTTSKSKRHSPQPAFQEVSTKFTLWRGAREHYIPHSIRLRALRSAQRFEKASRAAKIKSRF